VSKYCFQFFFRFSGRTFGQKREFIFYKRRRGPSLGSAEAVQDLEFATALSMVCEDSCLYSTFIIFAISFRATGIGGWKECDSIGNLEKVTRKYEVEIRRIVSNGYARNFCVNYEPMQKIQNPS
jgi:hypothetical protein